MDEIIYKSEDTKTNLFITSIKSSYISKEIFSFLKIENLLKVIIYNKKLQNKFGYNLEYYKKISRKYRIYNKCGRGEVYRLNTKIKIFQGEYLNGERNGPGKEYYDNGKLKFEGEYLKGKRNGKGKEFYDNDNDIDKLKVQKEYDYFFFDSIEQKSRIFEENLSISNLIFKEEENPFKSIEYDDQSNNTIRTNSYSKGKIEYNNNNAKLKFEGEYLNGERNGKGKEYNYYGQLDFKGEYLNGERNGKGKEYYNNGKLIFEGEYLNGERNGKGKEYHDNGELKFEGEYLNGKRWNGKGYNINGNFELQISNGEGTGKDYDDNGELKF